MKSFLIVLLVALGTFVQAQDRLPIAQPTAEAATEALIPFYQLTTAQAAEMVVIQQRRIDNLQDIQPLLQSAYPTYLGKRRSIERNTLHSIERLLRTEQQHEILRQQRIRIRKHESDIIRALKAQGKSQAEIEMAIAEADYRGVE